MPQTEHATPSTGCAAAASSVRTKRPFDWRFSMSKAVEDQPDQTQFAAYWVPDFQVIPGLVLPAQWIAYPPAQNSFVGWVQHINYYNEENSVQGAWNAKLPFTQWNGQIGRAHV